MLDHGNAVNDLAPGGTLRAAINVGNAVLAQRPATPGGEPTGISVDLARELGRRLGVPVQLIVFDAAGKVVEAGKQGGWDIAFVALDPARAAEIAQTPPYVQIEGAYLVPQRLGAQVERRSRPERPPSRGCAQQRLRPLSHARAQTSRDRAHGHVGRRGRHVRQEQL